MDEIHSIINKLSKIDSFFSSKIANLIECRTKNKLTADLGLWFKQSFAAVSLKEGALWAKCFRVGDVVRIFEADFMIPIGKIEDATIREKLEPIDNSPGFFMFTTNDLLQSMNDDVRNGYHNWTKTDPKNATKDVCRSSVPEFIVSQCTTLINKRFETKCEYMAGILLEHDKLSKAEVMFTTDGPSALTVIKIKSAEEVIFEVQIDTVPCIELSSWPDQLQYQQWVNRKRKWPTPQLVSQAQHLLFIVAKAPPGVENEIEASKVWRLSFSKVEMLYTSTYTQNQRNIYYLFKILFYANIKKFESGGKTMPSYFCKTTMLWLMEEEGDGLGEVDFEEAIKMLLQKLNEFLENGLLPNFFYPSVNLLDGYPEELIAICSYMIKELTKNPLHYVPRTLDNECKFLEIVEENLKRLELIKALKMFFKGH